MGADGSAPSVPRVFQGGRALENSISLATSLEAATAAAANGAKTAERRKRAQYDMLNQHVRAVGEETCNGGGGRRLEGREGGARWHEGRQRYTVYKTYLNEYTVYLQDLQELRVVKPCWALSPPCQAGACPRGAVALRR